MRWLALTQPWEAWFTEWLMVCGGGSLLIGAAAWASGRLLQNTSPRAAAAIWWCALVRLVLPPSCTMGTGWFTLHSHRVTGAAASEVVSPIAEGVPSSANPWAIAWITVGAVLAARTVAELLRSRRAWSTASLRPPSVRTAAIYGSAASAMGMRRRPPLWISDDLGPACVGTIRPKVVVPSRLESMPGLLHLEAALLHELAHAKRRDGLRRIVARLVRIAFWFHPVAWLAERRLAALAELDCDRRSSRVATGGASAYRTSLLRFAAATVGLESPSHGFNSGWAPRRGELMQRLTALSQPARPWTCLPRITASVALLAGSAAAVGFDEAPLTDPGAAPGFDYDREPQLEATHAQPSGPAASPVAIADLEGSLLKRYAVMAAVARTRQSNHTETPRTPDPQ